MITKPPVLAAPRRVTAQWQRMLNGLLHGLLLCGFVWLLAQPAYAQRRALAPFVPPAPVGMAWLRYDSSRHLLRPYIPGYDNPPRVLYYWVDIRPDRAVRVLFRARQGLSLFLDNRLVFVATKPGSYSLDLASFVQRSGRHLLAYWHPATAPDPSAFGEALSGQLPSADLPVIQRRVAADPNREVFIVCLLVVGLLYGVLRVSFGISLSRFFRFQVVTRQSSEARSGLGSLPSTPLTVLFILAFALSFALLIVIVHTNLENGLIFRYLFPLSDLAVTVRVAVYTGLVFAFVLARYLFLYAMGYVFDLTALVRTQYREFVRTVLGAGVYLPPLILLHLALSDTMPTAVLQVSNTVLALLLLLAVGRSAVVLHHQRSLFNLHLFSYLCATEVIPLIVLLKLIVFPYV